LHRVLGRVMLRERLVQGLDKVYTINGWVKGENAWRLDSVMDLGQDGRMGGLYQYVAKDVMGYELKYFSGDYKAVGLYSTSSFSNFVSLYNGNIAMSVLQQDTMEVMGRRYRYDALNRLKDVDALMGVGFTAFSGYRERFSYDRDGNITRLTRYAKASVMDSLKYNYYAGNNRLECVNDAVSASSFTNDIDNQGVGNYKYDKTGNLVEDVSESIRIHWTYYNKVKRIDSVKLTPPKYGLILGTKLRMKYDALGNRVVKEVPKKKQKEIYVRDAQGNVIALYEVKQDSLYSKEFYMYGSQRLGYLEDGVFMGKKCIGKWCNVLTPVLPMFPSTLSNSVSVVFGKKRYEISDWLGNVRVVINDRKTPINIGSATVGYKAQVVGVSDYYSFGSEIAERTYEVVKPLYRFGFQAQEKDNEIYGKGNTYYFKFREHDARIGRFWSVDPLVAKYPHYSPYQFSGNRLTDMVELEGLEPKEAGKEVGETREAPQVGQEGQGNKLWGWTGSEWGYSAPEVTVEGSKVEKKLSESNSYSVSNIYRKKNNFDVEKAVSFLNKVTGDRSIGKCASYVRKSLEVGGINTNPHPISAKDYGPFLSRWGFTKIIVDKSQLENYKPLKGDIGVIQPYEGGSIHGHIQMFNGSIWVSDFKQKSDFWPGSGYRKHKPDFEIYRWKNNKP
jgi:hypothetical protein